MRHFCSIFSPKRQDDIKLLLCTKFHLPSDIWTIQEILISSRNNFWFWLYLKSTQRTGIFVSYCFHFTSSYQFIMKYFQQLTSPSSPSPLPLLLPYSDLNIWNSFLQICRILNMPFVKLLGSSNHLLSDEMWIKTGNIFSDIFSKPK